LKTDDGKPANFKAICNAKLRGINLSRHVTSRVEHYEPRKGDLIIAMEQNHIKNFKNNVPENKNIQLTLLGLWGKDRSPYIHDPYNCNISYFNECFERIERCINEIACKISKNSN
jgi:protein-tyrosine phosphatase